MNHPKTTRKILLILADSIIGDIVLNNKLFNTRSITFVASDFKDKMGCIILCAPKDQLHA